MGYTTITYNGISINAINISAIKIPATRKQKLGQVLVQSQVFTTAFDYQITIQGQFVGTSTQIDTWRTALEDSQDNFKHTYTDGITTHNGDYIITSLLFDDNNNAAGVTHLNFNLTLIQDQFTGGTT